MVNSVEVEEMMLPIERGCNLHVIRMHCDTEDEKFICRLYDADANIITMTDPWDELDQGLSEFEEVKVFHASCLAEVIGHAYSRVEKLNEDKVTKLLNRGLDKLTVGL